MFKKLNILDEKNKVLRQKSKDVKFPIDQETKDLVDQIITHLTYSQIEEYAEKYDLRPGMGLAFVHLQFLLELLWVIL